MTGYIRQLDNFMRTDLFDFELPAESIALRPASPRDSARMLVVQPGAGLRDQRVRDLPEWLRPGDQLVVNDTRVIAAQLHGRRIGRETETEDRRHSDQAPRRFSLERIGQAGQETHERETSFALATRDGSASLGTSMRRSKAKARRAK